jgi:phage-related protein
VRQQSGPHDKLKHIRPITECIPSVSGRISWSINASTTIPHSKALITRLTLMSDLTYLSGNTPRDRPVAWLAGAIESPPFSAVAKREAGFLIRQLQRGHSLSMPESRPMPTIGRGCHELRIRDAKTTWRIIYRVDPDAIVLLEIFKKKTNRTPKAVIDTCKQRLRNYDAD